MNKKKLEASKFLSKKTRQNHKNKIKIDTPSNILFHNMKPKFRKKTIQCYHDIYD